MKKLIFSVVMFLVVFIPSIALALPIGSATLTWDPPITNVDATPLTDLGGYKLYYGTGSGSYTVNVNIPCGILPCPGFASNPPSDLERQQKSTSHPTVIAISGLEDNRSWYFAATALDTSTNESGYSNEVAKFIPSSVTDTDGDGMTDVWETANGLNPNNAADATQDADGDGLTNIQEFGHNTDPKKVDTDGDGMTDAWEIIYGLNPNNATDANQDADGDGSTNIVEYRRGTNPNRIMSRQNSKGDFNGDGKDDLLDFERHVGASTVFLSTGTAFTSYIPPSPLTNCCHWLFPWMKDAFLDQHEMHTGDFNGDGKNDVLDYERSVGAVTVFLSTGTSFTYTPPVPLNNCCHWLYPWMKDSFPGQHEMH